MSLKLYAPGERKGNKVFVARGSIAGHVYEFSTGTTDAKAARRVAREFAAKVKAAPADPDKITFAEAARRYVEFRNPRRDDRRRIDIAVRELGTRRIRDIRAADLHEAALRVYAPGVGTSATRNREVIRPAATVLHHAADAGLCDWIRVRAFKEPRPKTRALDPAAAALLVAGAEHGPQRLLLTWLFFQGTRISDTLRVDWSDIDLDAKTVRIHVSKTDRFETFPLHEATLRELGPAQTGRVFPWSNRSSLRRWLPALCARVGVEFTPHMARHTLGTMMAANGESLRAIMAALGHTTASSSLRYQAADIEMVRTAAGRVQLPQAKKLGNVA